MFLAVDVGNTQTKLGLFDEAGQVRDSCRLDSDPSMQPDELLRLLEEREIALPSLGGVGIASVVPAITSLWTAALERGGGPSPAIVSGEGACGIELLVDNPAGVGPDRIANAVAAREAYGSPAIVVDFGTATNIEVVDAAGAFRGGAIMPGMVTSAEALFARAARISDIPLEAPDAAIGASTEAAVQSGVVLGAAAQAEGLVERMRRELAEENPEAPAPRVIATGGLARLMASLTDVFDVIDPELTLRGIYQLWLSR